MELFCYNHKIMIIKSKKELKRVRSRNKDKKIVMLNGGFDLLHTSHLGLIKKAKSKGDILVVCITSDKNLREVKGSSRPIIRQAQRAEIVDAIEYVDYVFLNNDINPKDLASWPGYYLRPDLLISGDRRWYHHNKEVSSLGIKTKIVKRGKLSTTDIINKIKNAEY